MRVQHAADMLNAAEQRHARNGKLGADFEGICLKTRAQLAVYGIAYFQTCECGCAARNA